MQNRANLLVVFVLVVIRAGASTSAAPPVEVATTQPSWLMLGGLVYHEETVTKEEQGVLAFDKTPWWFESYAHPATEEELTTYREMLKQVPEEYRNHAADVPKCMPDNLPCPKSLADVPTEDRGVRLSLRIAPTADTKILHFDLDLTSANRPVWREVQHRWTTTIPMLFAIFVDGKAMTFPNEENWERRSGVNKSILLIPNSGGERHWSLTVDAVRLRKLLPDEGRHQVAITAAFSERQVTWRQIAGRSSAPGLLPPDDHTGPQILVRSELSTIDWNGKDWESTDEKASIMNKDARR